MTVLSRIYQGCLACLFVLCSCIVSASDATLIDQSKESMRRLMIQYYLYIDDHVEADSFEIIKQHTKALGSYMSKIKRSFGNTASTQVISEYTSIKSQLKGVQEEILQHSEPSITTVYYLNEGMTRVENALDTLAKQTNTVKDQTRVGSLLVSAKLMVLNLIRLYGERTMETPDGTIPDAKKIQRACGITQPQLDQIGSLSKDWSARDKGQVKRLLRKWKFIKNTLCSDNHAQTFFLVQAYGNKMLTALDRLLSTPQLVQQTLK